MGLSSSRNTVTDMPTISMLIDWLTYQLQDKSSVFKQRNLPALLNTDLPNRLIGVAGRMTYLSQWHLGSPDLTPWKYFFVVAKVN